jgi:hypothetical protein
MLLRRGDGGRSGPRRSNRAGCCAWHVEKVSPTTRTRLRSSGAQRGEGSCSARRVAWHSPSPRTAPGLLTSFNEIRTRSAVVTCRCLASLSRSAGSGATNHATRPKKERTGKIACPPLAKHRMHYCRRKNTSTASELPSSRWTRVR